MISATYALYAGIAVIVGIIRIFQIIPAEMWKNGRFLAIFAIFQARTFEIGKDERKMIVFFETDIALPSINVQTPQSLDRIWLSKLSFFPYFCLKMGKMDIFFVFSTLWRHIFRNPNKIFWSKSLFPTFIYFLSLFLIL